MEKLGITHIVFDVDGTLTDGSITISSNGVESKDFQAKDGIIVRELPKLGFTTMFLTGRDSELTNIRAKDLKISEVVQGVLNKEEILRGYMAKHHLSGKQLAYIGDDVNDYVAMSLCAFKACPADAVSEIKSICDYVSSFNGGDGAVRDICEHLLHCLGKYKEFLDLFGIRKGR